MVVISQGGMLALNIILLLLGPITVAVVVVTAPGGYKGSFEKIRADLKVWIQAPVLLVTCFVATLGLAAIYSVANTYVSADYEIPLSLQGSR
jgi:hypothetical protein